VGRELNAVAQNLTAANGATAATSASPSSPSSNYHHYYNQRPRSSSGGSGGGGLPLERGHGSSSSSGGKFASTAPQPYALQHTNAGALNTNAMRGMAKDGRPGSSGGNSGGFATPVPPLAFPLDGFNFGGDSCEVNREDDVFLFFFQS